MMLVFSACVLTVGGVFGFLVGYVIGARNMKNDIEMFTKMLNR